MKAIGEFNYLGKDVDGELPEGDDTITLEPIRETIVQGKELITLGALQPADFKRILG